MSGPTREQVLDKLRTVNDPELHKDLVSLKMVKDVQVDGGDVRIHIALTTPACPLKDQIKREVEEAVRTLDGISSVAIEFSAEVRGKPPAQGALQGVKNIVAVGAGKGGVGKSTAAVLLAIGLKRKGAALTEDEEYCLRSFFEADAISSRFVGRVLDEHGNESVKTAFLLRGDQPGYWLDYLLRSHKGQFYRKRYPSLSVI